MPSNQIAKHNISTKTYNLKAQYIKFFVENIRMLYKTNNKKRLKIREALTIKAPLPNFNNIFFELNEREL